MVTKRDEVIDVTCRLLEQQGYHATGLNQILSESGAPKGSLYYYFPKGKEELAVEAVARSARGIAANIAAAVAGDDPAQTIPTFVRELARRVAAADYRQGGPITGVALEAASTNEPLRLACRDAYRAWQRPLAEALRPVYGAAAADSLAVLIIAALEGAIILARTERSPQPLLAVADTLAAFLAGARP
jgi:TetR/AcrR family transcriptional regulator, lmrAB and yxaGH operons repressor